MGLDGHVRGGVGHAGQHEALLLLVVVQEGLVGLVDGALLRAGERRGRGQGLWSLRVSATNGAKHSPAAQSSPLGRPRHARGVDPRRRAAPRRRVRSRSGGGRPLPGGSGAHLHLAGARGAGARAAGVRQVNARLLRQPCGGWASVGGAARAGERWPSHQAQPGPAAGSRLAAAAASGWRTSAASRTYTSSAQVISLVPSGVTRVTL